ncbi:hypothetical protein K450DRAFT_250064 [Umbelopsis ramanniana AG]|uniref:Uncharacterized protein n=1 Tax=Umbelopsis ramanniana AG TaxID=1314678 RepID=A0AAD5HCE6_UMBRA|nr:uncharacterized protein K450DRAFT_250064 [Umbelopsis ramanniana AG]KAI8577799.1 hypothetical protein K450DRAFT_250064 [Umbelopsis ramanniana AG]
MPPDVSSQVENTISVTPTDTKQASKFYRNDTNRESTNSLYEEAINIIPGRLTVLQTSKDLPAAQQPFHNRLNRLQRYPDCPGVSIAYDLLTHTGFATEPLHFINQPKLERKFGDLTLVSDADYVVVGQISSLTYMVVTEDLSGKQTFDRRRKQMVGDMLVAATTRHDFFLQSESEKLSPHVYGMLLWKSNVNFYQATLKHETIVELQPGRRLPYCNQLRVQEDANWHNRKDTSSLSLFDHADRETIAYTLSGIRKTILRMRHYA